MFKKAIVLIVVTRSIVSKAAERSKSNSLIGGFLIGYSKYHAFILGIETGIFQTQTFFEHVYELAF